MLDLGPRAAGFMARSSTPDYGSGESSVEDSTQQGDDAGQEPGEASEHLSVRDETPAVPGFLIPNRVKRALYGAKDFAAFREARYFRFLHVFSGPKDKLSEALKRETEKAGMKFTAVSLDKKIDKELDLSNQAVMEELKNEVSKGEYDYVHGGFPCSSFSRARWSKNPGPKPVRSKEEIYGLSTNSVDQQAEADLGTLMATSTTSVVEAHCVACRKRGVPEAGTLENPPGDQQSGSAWDLGEVKKALMDMGGETVDFNTCAYQTSKKRWYKSARWGGKIDGGLKDLSRVCRCPAWVFHVSLVGKEKTEASGEYPDLLCDEIAAKVIRAWKRTLNLEWWRNQVKIKGEEVSELQRKWLENEEKKLDKSRAGPKTLKRTAPGPDRESMGKRLKKSHERDEKGEKEPATKRSERQRSKRAASPVRVDDIPRTSGTQSKKEVKELENDIALGGMRNPDKAVQRLWAVREQGAVFRDRWEDFAKRNPAALLVGKNYATNEAKLQEELVTMWTQEMDESMGDFELHKALEDECKLKENFEYTSPLNKDLWLKWRVVTKDPDNALYTFMKDGVPLGMEQRIPTSNGIFPSSRSGQQTVEDEGTEFEVLRGLNNYTSVQDQPDEAEIEIQRYMSKGYVKKMTWDEVEERLGKIGTVSKLALILKQKADNTVKRRIVIDLRRSGGNLRAKVEERLILPRISDVLRSLRKMRALEDRALEDAQIRRDTGEIDTEIFLIDLKDAFCHFAIHKDELRHCVSPGVRPGEALVWVAMLFGFKAAPLLMARLSSALGRLIQSMVQPHECMVQIYVDDILLVTTGSRRHREHILSMVLHTLASMGMMLSLDKGERGTRLTWIGTTIELREDHVEFGIPEKMVKEVLQEITGWPKRGMVPCRTLRSITGKLSWIAGILPRTRWCTSVFYRVLAAAEQEALSGQESQRAMSREDQRDKSGLVAVKRLGAALAWITKVLQGRLAKVMVRREELEVTPARWGLVTDASPLGLGATLIRINEAGYCMIAEAYEAKVSREEARLLKQDYGEASSQAVMETYAVLRGLYKWQQKLVGETIVLKSDSTVALAIAGKLASSTPVLNYLAGEIAYVMEEFDIPAFQRQFLPGKLNVEADWLSRAHNRPEMPRALVDIKIFSLQPWKAENFALPPPGAEAQDWAGNLPHQQSVWGSL